MLEINHYKEGINTFFQGRKNFQFLVVAAKRSSVFQQGLFFVEPAGELQ